MTVVLLIIGAALAVGGAIIVAGLGGGLLAGGLFVFAAGVDLSR